MSFIKVFLVSHVINQGRKIYSGRHACLTKENVTEMLRASRCHHLCLWSTNMHILALYLCWRSKLNHSQKIITKCDGIITNCYSLVDYKVRSNCYYKLRQLFYCKVRHSSLQIATGITKCDGFVTNCDRYYKVRWLLQVATVHRVFLEFMAIDKPKEGSAGSVRLPMMAAYKGRLRPQRVPFSGLRYMEG